MPDFGRFDTDLYFGHITRIRAVSFLQEAIQLPYSQLDELFKMYLRYSGKVLKLVLHHKRDRMLRPGPVPDEFSQAPPPRSFPGRDFLSKFSSIYK